MQLIEYFVWSKTFDNRLISQLGLVVLLLQPFFSLLQITNLDYVNILCGVYFLFIGIIYTIVTPWSTIDFKTIPSKNGHLAWKWTLNTFVGFIWLCFLLFPLWQMQYYLAFWFGLLSYIIAFWLYNGTYTLGSLWCWFVNIFSIYFIGAVFWKDLSVKFCM